ncbi:TPA: DUF551 domain-containing protein [Yersinia enterocolitica]|nr:DUF551 domain-containing protein [Yersinia enterocolitica]HDL6982564.1 DUF551 domain-containing protein [Yersinia enterocolitica]HDL7066383.1 DUF551 domain-containing protein [Yersinia enterocolitica]HDL7070769.1 DUF551 domain-containing protein [Yersinia enterocolitica]
MKELDSFTVDRLKDLINQYVHEEYNDVSDEEVIKLVSIALAAKRAVPVGYVAPEALEYKNFDNVIMIENASGRRDTPLYITPQLNPPEISEGWIKCSDRMPEDDTLCLGVDECGVIWTMHFDDGEFQPDTGDVDDLKISHWMPLPDAPEKPV